MIVGLGNPGPRYAGTRHNVGFLVAERLAGRWGILPRPKLCRSEIGEGEVEGCPVRLVFPQTFMNASGEAVACLMKRWRVQRSSLLVVCDDVSLPLGVIRLRGKGSHGGHFGLASILEKIGTQEIPRLRVGIRSTQARGGSQGPAGFGRGGDLTPFVLGRFAPAEKKRLEEGLEVAAEACQVWVKQGLSPAMNRFNRRVK